MKVRRIGVDGAAVHPPHALAQDTLRDRHSTYVVKPSHQTSAATASRTLPEELVEELLVRVPPDEPAHLVRAAIVCKAWRSIICDDTFRRRYRSFHRTPRLQGYFCNNFSDSTVRLMSTTSVATASPLCAFKFNDNSGRKPVVRDCRHGRVLIETDCSGSRRDRRLIVWDTIAGSKQHLDVPTHPEYPYRYNYVGAVLCAKEGCGHLDCHGGPFKVVLVGMSYDNDDEEDGQTWASVYSSETGAWSSPTTPDDSTNMFIDDFKPGLLIGSALYYISGGYNIIKYDLCKHELSVIHLPEEVPSILVKGKNGGLGVAYMLCTCIHMWSWRVSNKGVGRWVKYRKIVELLDTLLPTGDYLPDLICMVEDTNTVFIGVEHIGVFALDLGTRQVRKIGEPKTYYNRPLLPYMSFSTPKD